MRDPNLPDRQYWSEIRDLHMELKGRGKPTPDNQLPYFPLSMYFMHGRELDWKPPGADGSYRSMRMHFLGFMTLSRWGQVAVKSDYWESEGTNPGIRVARTLYRLPSLGLPGSAAEDVQILPNEELEQPENVLRRQVRASEKAYADMKLHKPTPETYIRLRENLVMIEQQSQPPQHVL